MNVNARMVVNSDARSRTQVTFGLGHNYTKRYKPIYQSDEMRVEQEVAARLREDPNNARLSDLAWDNLLDREVKKEFKARGIVHRAKRRNVA